MDNHKAQLLELSGFALAHGLWTAPGGELVPFVLSEDNDGTRELARFMTEADEALKDARDKPRWAMCQWGLLEPEREGDPPTHCMRVDFGQLTRPHGSVMWAFEPAKHTGMFGKLLGRYRPLRMLAGPEIAFGKREKDLVGATTPEAKEALIAGMKSHQKAWKRLNIN